MADIKRSKINRIFENLEFDIIHIHTPFVLGRLGLKTAERYAFSLLNLDGEKLKEFYYRVTLFLFPSLYDAS